MHLDRGVKWNNRMTSGILSPRQANVTDDTDEPAARNENAETVSPNLVQLFQKNIVIVNGTQLTTVIAILFKCPVWRRRDDQMHRTIIEYRQVA